jgi:RNA polymerase sigma-70 factor (ECF subfamily)
MGTAGESSTSLTLLSILCGPEKDEDAWQRFCQRYQSMIRRWCKRWRLQDADVDDVTQKVLKKLFTSIKSYDPDRGGFRSWLRTIVTNAIKDLQRSRARRPGDQGSGDSDVADILNALSQPDTLASLVQELDTSLRQDLDEILARVEKAFDPETMRAFRLTVLEGQPTKDVAAQLGKSYAAVCVGVRRLKKRLEEEGAKLRERRAKEVS